MRTNAAYYQSVAWFITSLCIGCANDTVTKLLGLHEVHPIHITFARFFFGLLTLLPYYPAPRHWKTGHPLRHLVRGILLTLALSLWHHGLLQPNNTIALATVISFTIPLFTLLLAALFLREPLTFPLVGYTVIAFLPILLLLYPTQASFINLDILPLLLAALLFGGLDVINKHSLHQAAPATIILYNNLIGASLLFPVAVMCTPFPDLQQIALLVLLGVGSNVLIITLLNAYRTTPLVALAPLRYLELPLSTLVTIIVFHEVPYNELLAALIIIPAVLGVIYEQQKATCSN